MRGSDGRSGSLFSYVDLEARVRSDHPLRLIREIANAALADLTVEFAALYPPRLGRPSIAPEWLLRAMLLQAFYGIRSERQLMERMEFDLLFRWFVGLGVDDPAWDHSSFTKNRERLLSLLMPVQRAGEHCPWLNTMIDAGEIFHPLRWSPQQALQFLKDVPALESAGVVVRMPASWRMNRPARPQVKATIGDNAPSRLGLDALLNFRMEVTLDGESLSAAEVKRLLAQSDGLALIRGKWVEVDHERLGRTLEQFEAIERHAVTEGLSLVRRCACWPGLASPKTGPPDRPTLTGAKR